MNETSTPSRARPRSRADRVHDGRHAPRIPEQVGSVRPAPGRTWGLIGLVVLTAVTSLVVATISAWLVPVYMTAMVLIFAAPRSPRPVGSETNADEPSAARPEDVAPPRADGVDGSRVEEAPEVVADPPASTEGVEPAAAKPRKRRAKARRGGKAAQAAEAPPSEPTWIRIGPGKFVRADVQAAPADAGAPAPPTSDPEAEDVSPTEAETTTLTAADLQIQAEATPAADVEPDAEAEAVDVPTHEDATPASPYEAEPSEVISPASFIGDEPEPTESDEEYGIAPSALAGAFDEEYGIAPSALAETWIPEAFPECVADDEPEPAAEPIEAEQADEVEDRSEARSEVMVEAEIETRADAPEAGPETPPATAVSPISGRPAPGERAAAPRKPTPARVVDLVRRVARTRKRLDRARPPRRHGAEARPTCSGRADRVRVRKADRGRRRSDPTGRRPHPRSPPRRA